MNTGKCPKCDKTPISVVLEAMDVRQSGRSAWKGVSYLCSHCRTILSVGIDPVALMNDTVDKIRRGLPSNSIYCAQAQASA